MHIEDYLCWLVAVAAISWATWATYYVPPEPEPVPIGLHDPLYIDKRTYQMTGISHDFYIFNLK